MPKKSIFPIVSALIICVLAFALMLSLTGNSGKQYDKLLKSDQPVYELIKTESGYSTAKIKDKRIIFYDENFNELKTTDLTADYREKLLYIEKRSDSVIFWHSGALDDTDGIMFLEKSWSDATWNGLARISKLSGNAYEVHTYR